LIRVADESAIMSLSGQAFLGIVFCSDYRCSHNVTLAPAVVDQWPDDVRPSDIEQQFVCKACGKRGAGPRDAAAACRRQTRPPKGGNPVRPEA
jgi:hypothetical protein